MMCEMSTPTLHNNFLMSEIKKIERILGIDPGFGRVGLGIIEKRNGVWVHVGHGLVETSPKKSFIERLWDVHTEVEKIVKKYKPTRAAVEELFFAKNTTTAIQVAQARGVILLTLIQSGIPVDEFTPLQVKQALTGYGRAEKSQIQKMVLMTLHMKEKKLQDDAADALALALTSAASLAFTLKTRSK